MPTVANPARIDAADAWSTCPASMRARRTCAAMPTTRRARALWPALGQRAARWSPRNLNAAAMVRNRRLARALSDAALGGFLAMLRYKCLHAGVAFHQADRWYPSTKTCSGCGAVQSVALNVRTYRCACGLALDRDVNGARNLAGLVAGSSPETVNGRRERVSPGLACSALRSVYSRGDCATFGAIMSDVRERHAARHAWPGSRVRACPAPTASPPGCSDPRLPLSRY